ncbi:paraneoplastic antigen Ma1-like [Sardina pilchardus]|uniref:paraneoplastic antigen Ma1-like n=1 Tax=Sardina pilchardus TaxID=27697 RepID=UPI002E1196D4
MPEQVGVGGEVAPWLVSIAVEAPPMKLPRDQDVFKAKLQAFLAHEGKTLADMQDLCNPVTPPSAPLDLNTQLVNAISALVDKCQTAPVENTAYRKLRLFSGVKPTPPGEEEYDAWAEQTTHMLDEWKCPDSLKKQRIAECLKGPAADIVRCLRVRNPNAMANDYLRALETAFGTTENATDLMFKFRNTFQLEGEKLSAYVLRLDKLLHSVLRKGGVSLTDLDKTRIEQVARGALSHDLVALRIRLTYKLRSAPSFTELLCDVREEEAMILERPAAPLVAASAMVGPVEYATVSAVSPWREPSPVSVATEKGPSIESLTKEVEELKTEVTRLLSFAVSSPSVAAQTPPQSFSQKSEGRSFTRAHGERQDKPYRADVFCYRCGEDGHFQRECQNSENLKKVNQRLIKLKRPAGNSPGAQ